MKLNTFKPGFSLMGFCAWVLCPLLAAFFSVACNPQLVEINLPEYERKLVVEGYLEAGKTPSVLLTESVSYFDDPGLPVITYAEMVLTYGAVSDTLHFNPLTFHYESTDTIPFLADVPFVLKVKDTLGRSVHAETRFQAFTPVDSIESTFDDLYQARIIVHFKDQESKKDYYRITMYARVEDEDFSVEQNDNLFNGQDAAYSTGNRWNLTDTIDVRLYHIGLEWYDFLVSGRKAKVGAQNPLVEPVTVISNVVGGKGIFTTLNVDYRQLVIRR